MCGSLSDRTEGAATCLPLGEQLWVGQDDGHDGGTMLGRVAAATNRQRGESEGRQRRRGGQPDMAAADGSHSHRARGAALLMRCHAAVWAALLQH